MSVLHPWLALGAAAVSIPLLVLLYVLRLRRQRLRVGSTLLWPKVVEDLQVNAPFRRLRWSLLLLLQGLALLALLAALAGPMLAGDGPVAGRMILLIDRGASMAARVGEPAADRADAPTRLELALDRARRIVDDALEADAPPRIMVVAVGRTPRIVAGFDADRGRLRAALDSIETTDESADLQAALDLAGAFAVRAAGESDGDALTIVLSDGGLAPPEGRRAFRAPPGRLELRSVVDPPAQGALPGRPVDNLGIVALSAERRVEEPGRVDLFVALASVGPEPVETTLRLRLDGEPLSVGAVTVPAATARGPGETSRVVGVELAGGGVLSVRHGHVDDLAADDEAAIVVPPPRRPRIAVVHDLEAYPDTAGSVLLEQLGAAEPPVLRVMPRDGAGDLDRRTVDLVVFDRTAPEVLPGLPTLTLGAVPPGLEAVSPRSEAGRRVLSWSRRHPIMRAVNLDAVVFRGFGGYEQTLGVEPLAWGPDGPLIVTFRAGGERHVATGFPGHDRRRSNWHLDVSSAIFLQNVLEVLGPAGDEGGRHVAPGAPVRLRPSPGAGEIALRGPVERTVPVDGAGPVVLTAPSRVGVYVVEGADLAVDRLAVSLLDRRETDLRPGGEPPVEGAAVHAGAEDRTVDRPLWRWPLAAALGLLVLEWLVWIARTRR